MGIAGFTRRCEGRSRSEPRAPRVARRAAKRSRGGVRAVARAFISIGRYRIYIRTSMRVSVPVARPRPRVPGRVRPVRPAGAAAGMWNVESGIIV